MGLAHPRGSEQQQRIAVADPARARQLPDLLRVERGLRIEVEALEGPHERELGDGAGHLDAPLVLPRHLGLAQERQALAQRELRSGRLIEQPVQAVADRGELQARQHALQGFDVGVWSFTRPLPSPPRTRRAGAAAPAARDRPGWSCALRRAAAASARHRPRPGGGVDRSRSRRRPASSPWRATSRPACRMRQLVRGQHHRDRLPDQPPGHAVAVGVDLHAGIGMHPANELAHLAPRCPAPKRPKRCALLAHEALERRLAGGPVHPHIGHFAHPPREMRAQRLQRLESMTGDRVSLHVADPAFVLALGARPVRRARPRASRPSSGRRRGSGR